MYHSINVNKLRICEKAASECFRKKKQKPSNTEITIWKSFRSHFNPEAVAFCKAAFMGESNTVEEKSR